MTNDLIRRGDVIEAVTKTAIAWGVTGEPAILIATKRAIAALPAVDAPAPDKVARLVEAADMMLDAFCVHEDSAQIAAYEAMCAALAALKGGAA